MTIKTLEVDGIGPAIHAMRNPMNSWGRSDTHQGKVGEKDRELSENLAKAGPEHAKHLRMIMVWAEITGPRYWWTEFDTYRQGVEKISCSTMHKLTSRPLLPNDFEHLYDPDAAAEDDEPSMISAELMSVIGWLNQMMDEYKLEEDPARRKLKWMEIISLLPQSYLQRRTVMMSYAALRNIIKQRTCHKLPQWQRFIDWAKTLPESWMLFDENPFDIG